MNKKSVILVIIAVLISGCVTLSESETINVRPPSANGSQWAISAKAETGNWDDKVTLFVNGTQAAQGILAPANHHDIQIAGSYGQHIVIGICSRSNTGPVTYECHMYVDGSSVGTLTWLEDD